MQNILRPRRLGCQRQSDITSGSVIPSTSTMKSALYLNLNSSAFIRLPMNGSLPPWPCHVPRTFGTSKMSPIFAVLTTLLLFSGHVLSQSSNLCTLASFDWVRLNCFVSLSFSYPMSKAFNSMGQDPCLVAEYLIAPCYGGCQSPFPCITPYPHLA
jgi:hypothetical protein